MERKIQMANKSVFGSAPKGKTPPPTDTTNRAGGKAYKLGSKAALAQYAATGTFNDGFYATAENILDEVLKLSAEVDVEFIAKTAMYSRNSGRMKDMPALLAAHLCNRGEEGMSVLKKAFPHIIDNGKMLRNFVQIIRSGRTGRKSLGTAPKRLIQKWFESKSVDAIFKMSTGNDPSMADIIRLARPKAQNDEQRALYGYLIDAIPEKEYQVSGTSVSHGKKIKVERKVKNYDPSFLPVLVKEYEAFKVAKNKDVTSKMDLPKVPWEMVTGLPLSPADWAALAKQASWTQIRMNLNTFARHGVFNDTALVREIAAKIRNEELIKKAQPFPYQLLMTYLATLPANELNQRTGIYYSADTKEAEVPALVRDALHDAFEISTQNVPTIEGPVYVGVDVSGSMSGAITGLRKGATSQMRLIDVAALIGCTFLKKNVESQILPFSDTLFPNHGLERRDSVLQNAKRLSKLGGGGTNMGAVMQHLNRTKALGNLVIIISDCETWADRHNRPVYPDTTVMATEWAAYKSRNPNAKLVTINLAASETAQVPTDKNVLQLGGFSDSIWEIIKSFVEGTPSADHWVSEIEKIQLPV